MYRITLTSWTASFRYPNLISGFQPTLDVPPISTVLGLINAAAGKYVEHSKLTLGYYFEYEAKTTDLETIYQVELKTTVHGSYPSNVTKSNVVQREFLFNCKLILYLEDEFIVEYFRNPYYSLVLGRSGDLVNVGAIEEVVLTENPFPENIKGQIIPFNGNFFPGQIQALPKYFTNSVPRKNIGTESYSVISYSSKHMHNAHLKVYTDMIDGKEVDVYFHKLDFSNY